MARIRDEIARDGPITFARFMDLALYDPDGGYYRARRRGPGRDGDFLTAPGGAPDLRRGRSPRAVADAWDRLGRPAPFVLREHGAGTGALARRDPRRPRRRAPGPRRASSRYRAGRGRAGAGSTPSRARLTAAGHGRRARRRATGTAAPIDRRRPRQRGARRAADAPRRRPRGRPARGPRRLGGRRPSSTSRPTRRRRPSLARLAAEGIDARGGPARRDLPRASTAGSRARRPASSAASLLLIDYGYPAAGAVRPGPPPRRHAARLPPPPGPRRPVRPRRPPGPDRPRRRHRGRAGRRRRRARPPRDDDPGRVPGRARHRGRSSQAIQADPATTLEAYLAVRSALMRLLDPGAMGRFRVMAFGRAWPAGPPPAGFDYRLAGRPASADGCRRARGDGTGPPRPLRIARRNRAIYLLPARRRRVARFTTVGHDLTGSGARTCTRARRAPLPDILARTDPTTGSVDLVRPPPGHAPTARMSTRTANACPACGCALDGACLGAAAPDPGRVARREFA